MHFDKIDTLYISLGINMCSKLPSSDMSQYYFKPHSTAYCSFYSFIVKIAANLFFPIFSINSINQKLRRVFIRKVYRLSGSPLHKFRIQKTNSWRIRSAKKKESTLHKAAFPGSFWTRRFSERTPK